MYEQIQSILTLIATAMEVGFGLWFAIAFPLYCWKNTDASSWMPSATVEAVQSEEPKATSSMEEGNETKEIERTQGLNQKVMQDVEEKTTIAEGDQQMPRLDLRTIEILRTPKKVAVKVSALDALKIQVPKTIRRHSVLGYASFYIQDLQKVFEVLLPEGESI
ncbi:hypothetical protein NIES2135_64130 (plasmid) [Leptolyngbya boryana NIES-2135]|jgi:hypothetical protein|uniref:Uncharacterized protein n=1 Tax=Leptolyngbya boryana NIES-2135 TaxID=1973484 RepID=A0A1Z4JS72_LEPBY|nr:MULTISPECIES: hypothetical protein [Leptolyngbya]BAY59536.1 hypothetical protein NIES2135_64130 [Leptolyngbya boryana NIES-2135]MBD2371294.1 hypothetical protein [Leptolyngbya sp. FACHB-161]MBD2377772.1 hypothetical protein [Leptolyngbya sp. FACHB-238]MBD2402210.1 hypothetical protein [Leptolyngbya sp. FACHB-239]MBD2408703.1 hypothetical protein [Leptolyngbya sp. FACHB-402]